MKKIVAVISLYIVPKVMLAQCAMCRTQIKNNVSAGETSMAEGLNNGIMFLFFTPYVLVFLMIFLWFRYSKTTKYVSLSERLKS